MTVVNSVIIRPPVSIQDVRQVLGNSSTDLATLCVVGQINKWARYKPVRHSAVGVITEAQRKSVNYGIDNIPVWTGNGSVNKMGNFWFGVDTSSSNYPQCGLQTSYWSYLRPSGGVNSPYRLADFAKEAGSTYGYKHDVVAPIGGCTQSAIIISATGSLTIPFSGNGSGQSDGYTVPLSELTGVGVSTGMFGDMYMSVMIRKVGTSTYYVASRDSKWSDDNSTSVTRSVTAAIGNALSGSCEVFPFLSTTKFESFTNNLSGERYPVVAMFDKSAVSISVQYAKIDITSSTGYRDMTSQNRYVRIQLNLSNSGNTAWNYRATVKLYNSSQVEQTGLTGEEVTGSVAAGSTGVAQFNIYVAQIWSGLKNGYFTAELVVTDSVIFKKNSSLGYTQLTDMQPTPDA